MRTGAQVLDHVLSKELAVAYREAVEVPINKRKPRVIVHKENQRRMALVKSLKQYLA
jgi:hypothetical protein